MALELAVFDLIPKDRAPSFVRGFTAALIATSACYPLDTARRHIQLATGARVSVLATIIGAWGSHQQMVATDHHSSQALPSGTECERCIAGFCPMH